MPDSAPPDGGSISLDIAQKKLIMSGQNSLVAFCLLLVVVGWVYIAHVRLNMQDKAHETFLTMVATSQKTLLDTEAMRSKQIEELLRLNQRTVIALENIGHRAGRYLSPYEEQRVPQGYQGPMDGGP